ncbi:hypothetical protein [Pontibacter oryzae]|nr:hypothetical protein [Pontibacter oryzae]
MKPNALLAILTLFILTGFTAQQQQASHTIVGSWKLTSMQIGSDTAAKAASGIDSTVSQSPMRFVFEESGQFRMELGTDGRGLKGGYYYDTESQILSIRYGAHIDTAFVSWDGADRMIHASKDGKTRTTLQRVKD